MTMWPFGDHPGIVFFRLLNLGFALASLILLVASFFMMWG